MRLIGIHGLVDGAVISQLVTDPILGSIGVSTTASSSGLVDCWFLVLLLLVVWHFLWVSKEIANIEKVCNQWGALDQIVEVDLKIVHQLLGSKSRILHVVIFRW